MAGGKAEREVAGFLATRGREPGWPLCVLLFGGPRLLPAGSNENRRL